MSVNKDQKKTPKFNAKSSAKAEKKQKRIAFWNKYVWPTAEVVFGAVAVIAGTLCFLWIMTEACTGEPNSFHKPVIQVNPCSDYTVQELKDGLGEGCTH
jgi:hypothetical protein